MIKNSYSAWKFLQEVDLSSRLEESDSSSNELLKLSTEFAKRAGLSAFPGILINGVPIRDAKMSTGQLRKLIMNAVQKTMNTLAHDYFNGDYEDGDNSEDYSINKSTVFESLNPEFLKKSDSYSYLDFIRVQNRSELLQNVPYISQNNDISNTVWIVGDFDLPNIAEIGRRAVDHYRTKRNYRLALIPRNVSSAEKFCNEFYQNFPATCKSFVSNHVVSLLAVLPKDKTLIIVNGKIYDILSLVESDFPLLDQVTFSGGIALSKISTFKSNDILVIKSVIDKLHSSKTDLSIFDNIKAFSIEPRSDEPYIAFQMFVNPFDFEAHQIVTIITELIKLYNVKLDVYINPQNKSNNDKYFGYAFESTFTFDKDGAITDGPTAKIGYLPADTLLSASVSTIHNWMVSAVRTPYDLDNLVFNKALDGLCAVYRLEYIIVEGHCYDSVVNEFPAGLQFFIGNGSTEQFDTTVMRNIGYFQLKANPGIWWLRSGSNPAGDKYKIKSVTGNTGSFYGNRMLIIVDSFQSEIITVEVAKGESSDKEKRKGGILDNIFSSFSDKLKSMNIFHSEEPKNKAKEVVNVFSLASGHLYERLLKVMMLSVLNHTSSPIKFYFLKNFLSPSFKDFLPNFSRHYGFEYVLVEYVWPHWLRKQTVRQRIIWGYKILFLDVLFPLDVSRIIYLDADQTIRTDIMELFKTDLHGAPYGFTPFCDNRPEMDSYRFWKSSYWLTVLGGRPYHISALFVVNLDLFRKLSAGDILREQYHMLTADPGNLANLDQDLPNSLMKYIPVYSLDKSWLWCETWCSGASKARAKTIDLCNNPRTRESKLDSAFRIVPEWKYYDEEVHNFTKNMNNSSKDAKLDDEL